MVSKVSSNINTSPLCSKQQLPEGCNSTPRRFAKAYCSQDSSLSKILLEQDGIVLTLIRVSTVRWLCNCQQGTESGVTFYDQSLLQNEYAMFSSIYNDISKNQCYTGSAGEPTLPLIKTRCFVAKTVFQRGLKPNRRAPTSVELNQTEDPLQAWRIPLTRFVLVCSSRPVLQRDLSRKTPLSFIKLIVSGCLMLVCG